MMIDHPEYRIPPSPSMTGQTWRQAYYEVRRELAAHVARIRELQAELDRSDRSNGNLVFRLALLEKVAEAAEEYLKTVERINSSAEFGGTYAIADVDAAIRAFRAALAAAKEGK